MVCKALDGLKVYEVTGSIQTSRIVLYAVLSTIVGTSHVVLVLKKKNTGVEPLVSIGVSGR